MKTLDLHEAAELLKTEPAQVEEWINQCVIPAARFGSAWVMVDDDIYAFIRERISAQSRDRFTEAAKSQVDQYFACDVTDLLWRSFPAHGVQCIYFLFSKGNIVYVGKTSHLVRRLGEHARDKEFDSYSVIPCHAADLDRAENHFIQKFYPELNQKGKW